MTDKNNLKKDAEKHDDEQPGTSANAKLRDSQKGTSKKPHSRMLDESNQSPSKLDEKKHIRFDCTQRFFLRNRSIHQGPHRSRSSTEQNLKYKIYIRPKGHQTSQLIKNLKISPNEDENVEVKRKRRLSVHSFTDLFKEKHLNDQHNDLFFRPLHHLVYRRESLVELKKSQKRSKREIAVEKQSKQVKQYIGLPHRCQNCLHAVNHCNCHLIVDLLNEKKSDWTVLTQRLSMDGFQVNPKWTRKRIEWLEEIEATTEFDLKKIHHEVAVKQEICCFPFSTIRIFGKQKIDVIDYYRKENQ